MLAAVGPMQFDVAVHRLENEGDIAAPKLSAQELNVLRLVAEGLTNPEIGSRLFLSRHTVKEYVSHAMHKLEATNRIEAVRRATSLGLIAGYVGGKTDQVIFAPLTMVLDQKHVLRSIEEEGMRHRSAAITVAENGFLWIAVRHSRPGRSD